MEAKIKIDLTEEQKGTAKLYTSYSGDLVSIIKATALFINDMSEKFGLTYLQSIEFINVAHNRIANECKIDDIYDNSTQEVLN